MRSTATLWRVASLRREAFDHVLLLDEEHLGKVAREDVHFFNKARPRTKESASASPTGR